MHRFSAIATRTAIFAGAAALFALGTTAPLAQPASTAPANAPTDFRTAPALKLNRIVLLLPIEQPTLRRAAMSVRDGARAVAAKSRDTVELRECAYGSEGVVQAYQRCVTDNVDAVIGPLGRADVAALAKAHATLPILKPTVMLSPLDATPPKDFFVIAPDLESEAEAIARQSLEDACRKPMLVEMQGAIYSRVAVAILRHYKSGGVSTPLLQQELGARELWQRRAEAWRRDGIDCVLFAGSGSMIYELRPYLRSATIYITSSSFEAALDNIVDWSGVRIADSPFVLDPGRTDFASVLPTDNASPTLTRLFALGVDAARVALSSLSTFDPNSEEAIWALRDPRDGKGDGSEPSFRPIANFDGAIGKLDLRDGRYVRTPAIGEFRGRTPVLRGF